MTRDWNALVDAARAVDMLVVTERHWLKLAKRAHEYVGPCPHCGGDDRFAVNPGKGVFLRRQCHAGGAGAIDLEIFVSACTFAQAIETLTGEGLPSAEEARTAAAERHTPTEDGANQTNQYGALAMAATPGAARHYRRALPRGARLCRTIPLRSPTWHRAAITRRQCLRPTPNHMSSTASCGTTR